MASAIKSFFRTLIIILLVALAGYYLYLTYINPPPLDYTDKGIRLDQDIDKILVNNGIGTADIIKVFREEKKLNNIKWIQTTKEVRLLKDTDLPALAKALTQAVAANGAKVISLNISADKKTLSLKAGVNKVILESLLLRPKSLQKKYRAAILIDDLGYDNKVVLALLALREPLTFAILPGEHYTKVIAEEVAKAGYEVLLHQPMEPLDYPKDDPGKRAILVLMTPAETRAMLLKNIAELPYADGVNNHMGSKVTEDETKMQEIVGILKEHNLLFVDSRTSMKSVAYKTAKKMGLRAAYNQVFLDNENNLDYIKKQLDLVAELAVKNGRVVAIGHCERQQTLLALQEKLPEFKQKGIEIVPVSQLAE